MSRLPSAEWQTPTCGACNRYLTDEVVEKAAQALHDRRSMECGALHEFGQPLGDTVYDNERRADARAALEAAAPAIAAKALEVARGPYRCCPHCADDIVHDAELREQIAADVAHAIDTHVMTWDETTAPHVRKGWSIARSIALDTITNPKEQP